MSKYIILTANKSQLKRIQRIAKQLGLSLDDSLQLSEKATDNEIKTILQRFKAGRPKDTRPYIDRYPNAAKLLIEGRTIRFIMNELKMSPTTIGLVRSELAKSGKLKSKQ